MSIKHATDQVIQEYCLGNMADAAAIEHIQHCHQCTEKVAQYKSLFTAIGEQEAPAFDFNLTQLVMEQLVMEPLPAKQATDKYFLYSGLIAAASMLAIAGYVIKVYLPNVFKGLAPMLTGLIVLTGLCIVLFSVIDLYQKYMTKVDALNFS